MSKILTENEIKKFKEDGAIFLKNKFDISWINKLKTGIEKDISNPVFLNGPSITSLVIVFG